MRSSYIEEADLIRIKHILDAVIEIVEFTNDFSKKYQYIPWK